MVKIYHNKNFLNYMLDNNIDSADLEHVANVDTVDLEKAFELSQNIDDSWTKNVGVQTFQPGVSLRSTSVGDVLEYVGKFHVIEMLGFREIDLGDFGNLELRMENTDD